jgi:putative type IC restriction-modification system specificity subunit, partial
LRFPEFSGEWDSERLENLTVSIGDGLHSTPVYCEQGDYCFINGNNIIDGKVSINEKTLRVTKEEAYKYNAALLKVDTILMSINGTIGNVALYNGENIMLGKSACYINPSSRIVREYLFHILSSPRIQAYFQGEVTGTTIKNLSLRTIRGSKILLPSNEEQKKIARLFSLVDERIATQNKIIEDLKKLKSAIIDYAIDSLDTDFAKFSSLYETAGEGGTPTTSNASFYDNGKIPFVKIDDLKQKYLTENKDFITELGLQKSSAWLVPTRSILFSNGATIGEITITTYPVCTKQGILGIVPKSNIDVEFLYYFMSSTYFKKAVSRIVTEGTMKTAYLKDINNILCPIPIKEKQQGIAKIPSTLNSKIDFEQSILRLFWAQKRHLLSQMFI